MQHPRIGHNAVKSPVTFRETRKRRFSSPWLRRCYGQFSCGFGFHAQNAEARKRCGVLHDRDKIALAGIVTALTRLGNVYA